MPDRREVEKRLGRRDVFPNASAEADFDARSQTIQLYGIRKADFEADIRGRRFSSLQPQLATMLHELTHWADLVGTLWGREYLREVYAAYRLMARGVHNDGPESEFHRFVDLHDRTRRLMMGAFYRTEDPSPRPHDLRNPWGIQFSAGREFDPTGRTDPSRPIFFVRLLDNPGGELVARQPIVAGALLEIGAVWSEMRTHGEIFGALEPGERSVAEALAGREFLKRLYNPGLTLYTAPAHLLATSARITETTTAYGIGARLAHLVLNLDAPDFVRLAPPDEFGVWSDNFDAFRANCDRGFAFASLCVHGGRLAEGQSEAEWLDAALAAAGLDQSATILARARDRMRSEVVTDAAAEVGGAERYLLDLGERYFELRAASDPGLSFGRIVQANLPVPPMFDAEDGEIELTPGRFDRSKFSPQSAFRAGAALHTWTVNLLGGCR